MGHGDGAGMCGAVAHVPRSWSRGMLDVQRAGDGGAGGSIQ